MNRILVVMASNRTVEHDTEQALRAIMAAGARLVLVRGCSDVALARNQSLTRACGELRADASRDVVLMVDDDMHFSPEQVATIADIARRSGRAASGAYATKDHRLVARLDGEQWLTGLGFFAIPRAALLALEAASERVHGATESCVAFCWSGPRNGYWEGEDYCLSRRLAAQLLNLPVGHIKKVAQYPSRESLEQLLAGEGSAA